MRAIKTIATILMILAILDIATLFASMAQMATGGRTGYWDPFWRIQAEFVLNRRLRADSGDREAFTSNIGNQ